MDMHRNEFSLERMSKVFKVSRSGYYKFIASSPSVRELKNKRLAEEIRVIHKESRETYGSPRIHAQLKSQGESCSRKRVARIMQKAGIRAKMKKRFKITTKVNPDAKAAPNLLQQDFKASLPNQRWVADITYVSTAQGWLYVAAIVDLFSRYVVGLAMNETMTTELISDALKQAVTHRKPDRGLTHHSDKGCQYTSQKFNELLEKYGMIASNSGTGNCYDNAAMESFFHTLKTEHIYFENYQTREQAKQSIFEYVEVFYNRKRRHSTLGYLSPADFEKQWQHQRGFPLHSV
jgi:transposase InsO family protein